MQETRKTVKHKQTGSNRETVRLEKAPEGIADKLRMLVTHAPVGIVVAQDGFLRYVNPKAVAISGYSTEELTARPFVEFLHPDDRSMVMEHHLKRLNGDEIPETYVLRMVMGEGRVRYVENSGTIIDWEGRPATLNFLIDITERVQIEAQLSESQEFSMVLLDHVPTPILVVNADTSIKFVNAAFETLTGFSATELIGIKIPYPWWFEEAQETTRSEFTQAMRTGLNRFQKRFRTKNGNPFWVEISSRPVNRGNTIKYYLSAWVDITARKQADRKLKESEERYRKLVDNIAIGVSLISPDMEILTLNKQMKKWYPHIDPTKKPICYRAFNDPPRDAVCSYCPTAKTLRDAGMHEAITATPAGHETRHYRIVSSPILDPAGNVAAAIEVVEDITEQLLAEVQIRSLSQKLLRAHEDERRMIARELHDSVAQELSTLKIAFKTMLDDQRETGVIQKKASVSKLFAIVDRAIASVRNLSYDLRPPGLSDLGLLRTLATYCEEFGEENHLAVDFDTAGLKKAGRLDSFVEINLYRLVQEGLNNVRKHAQAGRVAVKLLKAHPNIILRIEDDGIGFDVQARERALDTEKRLGLRSMKERVNLLNGQMKINSQPGKGTKIRIKFPYKGGKVEPQETHHHH